MAASVAGLMARDEKCEPIISAMAEGRLIDSKVVAPPTISDEANLLVVCRVRTTAKKNPKVHTYSVRIYFGGEISIKKIGTET